MEITVMLDKTHYSAKPSPKDVAIMQKYNKLKRTVLTIEELAKELSSGATFRPALLEEGGKTDTDWICNYVFAIDFDHDCTIGEKLDKCEELGISPCFGYTSFSHSEEEHRFRLVFALPEPMKDMEKRDKLQNALANAFGDTDQVCKNPSRIFYGGRSLIVEDYEARIYADAIIEKYYIEPEKKATRVKSKNNEGKIKDNTSISNSYVADEIHIRKIEAIKALDVDSMRFLLWQGDLSHSDKKEYLSITVLKNPTPIVCKSQMELNYTINHLDLQEFLGIYGFVNCILPAHEDSTPSAHIYITDDGTQVYKCFGCNKARPIISIVEELAGCSRSEAIEFIKKVYNITFEITERIRKQQQQMIDSANFLDTEEFKVTFPYLYKLMRTRKHHLQKLLMHFVQYVTDDGIELDGKLLFWGSYPVLMEVCGINAKNPKTLSQSLIYFSLCNMLVKVSHETLPLELLNKAKHIATKYNLKKLTNFYQFEEYGIATLSEAEDIAKNLIENNISIAGISREYVLRTFGLELANKVFPQYLYENSKGTSVKSDNKTLELSKTLLEQIEVNGYCLERDIFTSKAEYSQWKCSIQEVLDSYGLVKLRLNKDIKEKYGVVCDGYPSIVVRRDS